MEEREGASPEIPEWRREGVPRLKYLSGGEGGASPEISE